MKLDFGKLFRRKKKERTVDCGMILRQMQSDRKYYGLVINSIEQNIIEINRHIEKIERKQEELLTAQKSIMNNVKFTNTQMSFLTMACSMKGEESHDH